MAVCAGVTMAGQSPVATISPRCSRCPEIRPEVRIVRSTVDDQGLPVTVGMPRSLRSLVTERRGSPARIRRAASLMTAASLGITF